MKYERVYLKAYDSVSAARADIAEYVNWYNTERPHSSLDVTGNQPALLPHLPRPYRSERSGLVANNGFQSLGVS